MYTGSEPDMKQKSNTNRADKRNTRTLDNNSNSNGNITKCN